MNGLVRLEWEKQRGRSPQNELERLESETLALQEENKFLLRLQEAGRLPMLDYLTLKALNKKRIEHLLKQNGATQKPAAPQEPI
ncbi:hypothetical protein C4571_02880 [Candidatus Parcubacteria bacterium]|nr:MAG: hypothetical protein C4571_02880 [Candidatus Parcubacteria bacterium]